jgi:hypothetical protein
MTARALINVFKHNIDPGSVIHIPIDHRGSPAVSFAHTSSSVLILLEGMRLLDKISLAVKRQTQPVALRYTVKEWEAFVYGVKDGEFDDYASGPASDLVPVRDSKDPDGPVLVFSANQMKPFFRAIKTGKYDI